MLQTRIHLNLLHLPLLRIRRPLRLPPLPNRIQMPPQIIALRLRLLLLARAAGHARIRHVYGVLGLGGGGDSADDGEAVGGG